MDFLKVTVILTKNIFKEFVKNSRLRVFAHKSIAKISELSGFFA